MIAGGRFDLCPQHHFHGVQESVKSESGAEKVSPVNLGQQLQYLQHQLTDLHLEKLLGPEASIDLSDPQGALRQWVLVVTSEKEFCCCLLWWQWWGYKYATVSVCCGSFERVLSVCPLVIVMRLWICYSECMLWFLRKSTVTFASGDSDEIINICNVWKTVSMLTISWTSIQDLASAYILYTDTRSCIDVYMLFQDILYCGSWKHRQ